MPELSTITGKRIKIRREALRMSQEELAQRLGYKSRSTIAKIELGVNRVTLSMVTEFANVLQTTPAWLAGWDN